MIRRPRPLPRQGRRLGPPEVWNLALGSQAKAHAITATPLSATCPSHLHAVCPASNPPNSPQASKATTLTATCPCHLFFRGFTTSLPGLKPSKRFRRPPRQQLLQLLHAPAICFSGGSRLPFARPQTPQTLPTLPQASKVTTLTATCPCHLFFRGFKTAVCPASNPPNASNPPAGLQGNNSYSYYMPLPSVFQGVQDCRLPGLKPPKRFQPSRRPPRQQLLQLHAPAIYFSRGSRLPFKATTLTATIRAPVICFSGGSRLPFARPQTPQTLPTSRRPPRQQLLQLHAPAICFSGGSRLPFARPQTPQTLPTLPQASKATTLTATCPCHRFYFSRGSRLPFAWPQTLQTLPQASKATTLIATYMPLPYVFQGVQARPHTLQTLPQASKATTLTATCPCHLFFRGFKTAVCPASNPPNASNPSAGLQGNNSYSYMPLPSVFDVQDSLSSVFQGVQDCRLPGLKPPKRFQPSRRPPRQQLLQLHAPAICFSGGSRLPFARPQTPQTLPTLPQASKATTLTATCPCHRFYFSRGSRLPFAWPQTLQTLPQASKATTLTATYMPLPSVFQGVQARPHTLQTLPQASKATTLTATCPCHLFFRGFKTAVCPASNPPNASNRPAGLQGNNSYSYYMPLPSVFQGVQDCCLPGLKPPKRFQPSRRPPRQQLLQLLHAPAICFSGGSRLPFARPQTPQTLPTLPQASKATTLTATCPCHLFFRGFKTAVCPASNPSNASNLPQASKATTLTATCPCHLFFKGFKTAV